MLKKVHVGDILDVENPRNNEFPVNTNLIQIKCKACNGNIITLILTKAEFDKILERTHTKMSNKVFEQYEI